MARRELDQCAGNCRYRKHRRGKLNGHLDGRCASTPQLASEFVQRAIGIIGRAVVLSVSTSTSADGKCASTFAGTGDTT